MAAAEEKQSRLVVAGKNTEGDEGEWEKRKLKLAAKVEKCWRGEKQWRVVPVGKNRARMAKVDEYEWKMAAMASGEEVSDLEAVEVAEKEWDLAMAAAVAGEKEWDLRVAIAEAAAAEAEAEAELKWRYLIAVHNWAKMKKKLCGRGERRRRR